MSSPADSKRRFAPTGGHDDPMKDAAEALDHIARALSAIDYNLEVLIAWVGARRQDGSWRGTRCCHSSTLACLFDGKI